MRKPKSPYIRQCSFCGDGLLRLYRCQRCDAVAAICDECELIWKDVEDASRDPQRSSDAAFPACPACGTKRAKWSRLSLPQIRSAGLEDYLASGHD